MRVGARLYALRTPFGAEGPQCCHPEVMAGAFVSVTHHDASHRAAELAFKSQEGAEDHRGDFQSSNARSHHHTMTTRGRRKRICC